MIEFILCVYDIVQQKQFHTKFSKDNIGIPMVGRLSMTEATHAALIKEVKEYTDAYGFTKPLWALYAHRKVEDTQSTLIMGLEDIRMDFATFVVAFLREEGFYD